MHVNSIQMQVNSIQIDDENNLTLEILYAFGKLII